MVLSEALVAGMAFRDGQVVDDDVTVDEIRTELKENGTVLWVDLLRPSPEVMRELAQRLDLAPTTVEDALAPHERPKVTRHGPNSFFTVYAVTLDPGAATPAAGRLRLSRVSGIVLPRMLITLRFDDTLPMQEVVARWTENVDLTRSGVGALVHGLLDTVVDGHFDVIQQLDDEIEGLEDELFGERQTDRAFVHRVYGFRKDLVALRRVVLPMREVVSAILRHRDRDGSDLDHWFDDLYDHVLRASEWTESLRDMVATVFETNLSLQDARLNTIMKKLAAWAAIIAIPTAVTGWFGQNIPYPGYQAALGLWLSVALIVALSAGLWLLFRRLDWL